MRTAEQNSSLGEGLTSSNATDISHHSCETHHYFLHCPWVSLWAIKYQHFFGPDRIHVSKVGCSWRSDGDKQCCWNTVSLCVLLILTRRSPASPKVALGLLSIARTRKRAVCHVSMANILASTSESNSYGWFMARIEPPPPIVFHSRIASKIALANTPANRSENVILVAGCVWQFDSMYAVCLLCYSGWEQIPGRIVGESYWLNWN